MTFEYANRMSHWPASLWRTERWELRSELHRVEGKGWCAGTLGPWMLVSRGTVGGLTQLKYREKPKLLWLFGPFVTLSWHVV